MCLEISERLSESPLHRRGISAALPCEECSRCYWVAAPGTEVALSVSSRKFENCTLSTKDRQIIHKTSFCSLWLVVGASPDVHVHILQGTDNMFDIIISFCQTCQE